MTIDSKLIEEGEAFIRKKAFLHCTSNDDTDDDLRSFRSCLRWMCLDQSNCFRAIISWTLFILLTIVVPTLSHFILACSNCDWKHQRPYDIAVQLSLSIIATLSFICLTHFISKYGLQRFLFLDKLCNDSEKVQQRYTAQLNRSFKLLFIFILPGFVAESAYKIWWYSSGGTRIPFLGNVYMSNAMACFLELCSWLYRTSTYLLICMLFRLICHLQILQLQDFALVFQEESDVAMVLAEHLRIRRQLKIISHRFRAFIVLALIFVSASQLASLLITLKSHADVYIFMAGELTLCSVGLVTGIFICLRSAAKITHKAQAITSHATKWHVCATIDSYDTPDYDTPMQIASCPRIFALDVYSDEEEAVDEDDMDDTKFIPPHAHTISFQKRQALVTYLENNRAGITIFGFMLDRTWLHTICAIELSLVLWLLQKTVGFS
ncbi:uncharacterized protein LOC131219599 [Magnolia sinica]|uniref:uncharacterized protein LOC131219599 n=1 Tax=Magnolia sinica TaxID=86752 RepID=UPI00265A5DD0|nr:uncharacterized protein LOC131219599 [Magnolia sinica]